jgi:succinoglycan biosynthesis protein ExoM
MELRQSRSVNPMRIVICICTFRNPEGLRQLLDGINRQKLDSLAGNNISIVVVDNDAEASAASVLDEYMRSGRFRLFAEHQLKRGLATARNSALDAEPVRASDAFAFIDDDEVPCVDWIEELSSGFSSPTTSIAIGPVEPIFEKPPPPWIVSGKLFRKECSETGELTGGYTSNVMIRTSVVLQTGLRFDESLNQIGGEDALFFEQLRMRGFIVTCSQRAIVYENIPASRASLLWILRRWLRMGVTSAHIRSQSISALHAVLLNLTGGIGRVVVGALLVCFVAISRGRKDTAAIVLSCATVCRGIGMLMFAFGRTYEGYGSSYRPKSK